MTSAAYRVCVDALERILSPRVVSRTLRMAMEPKGLTPESIGSDELAPILKGPVFRQLQVAMPSPRARAKVEEILRSLPEDGHERAPLPADEEGAGDAAPEAEPDAATSGPTEPTDEPGVAEPGADAGEPPASIPDGPPAELERLREALRPFNLYFEWPEVRRLRAQLASAEEAAGQGRDVAGMVERAEATLAEVRQTLEDRLVLQAQDVASLEEALEEVRPLGGPEVRRLASLVRRAREAQQQRQLADAEIERGSALARDLRKLMASSVYEEAGEEASPELEARLKALDVAGQVEELHRLARDWAVLFEHRPDLSRRHEEMRSQVDRGLTLGPELQELHDDLVAARRDRIAELRSELDDAEARLDATPEAWSDELRSELDVLRSVLADGLPSRADVLRFQDHVTLALERAARHDRDAEVEAATARARLDAQGELLTRARHELLRYGDEADGDDVERLRAAVRALTAAQAEERLDEAAADEVRAASDDLARTTGAHDDPARAQLEVLMARLDGLPARVDPDGAAELRAELAELLEGTPDEPTLASASAAVSDAVGAAHERVRRRLDELGAEASRWSLTGTLGAVREANERLEDGRDPDLRTLERRLEEDREEARRAQLDRLHALEREAQRLVGIDAEREAALQAALAEARARLTAGDPAPGLETAQTHADALAGTLAQRVEGVAPRLDAALERFTAVERLNSDDVATVRRILHHLDGQRAAFARVSPALRARMERSLREAERLLDRLGEEERATREIADQLMADDRFDDVLGLFGAADATAPEAPGGTAADDADASPGDDEPSDDERA
jgi:hypothetical protein